MAAGPFPARTPRWRRQLRPRRHPFSEPALQHCLAAHLGPRDAARQQRPGVVAEELVVPQRLGGALQVEVGRVGTALGARVGNVALGGGGGAKQPASRAQAALAAPDVTFFTRQDECPRQGESAVPARARALGCCPGTNCRGRSTGGSTGCAASPRCRGARPWPSCAAGPCPAWRTPPAHGTQGMRGVRGGAHDATHAAEPRWRPLGARSPTKRRRGQRASSAALHAARAPSTRPITTTAPSRAAGSGARSRRLNLARTDLEHLDRVEPGGPLPPLLLLRHLAHHQPARLPHLGMHKHDTSERTQQPSSHQLHEGAPHQSAPGAPHIHGCCHHTEAAAGLAMHAVCGAQPGC